MMPGEDDNDLLRFWRGAARETPCVLLDRRVLQAARTEAARRHLLLPLAAAMAACLALAVYAGWPRPAAMPVARPAAAKAALYDATAVLADPDAMHQMMIRQMPGGSGSAEVVSR